MAIERHHDDDFSELISKLRVDLKSCGLTFGALFVGRRDGDTVHFGFAFADGMPQHIRMGMLEDMKKALDSAKATFQL